MQGGAAGEFKTLQKLSANGTRPCAPGKRRGRPKGSKSKAKKARTR